MTETALENVLAKLTADERTVVLQRLEGLSCAEIGKAMGRTRQNVHAHELRACAKLGIHGTIQSVVFDAIGMDRRADMLERGQRAEGLMDRDAGRLDRRRLSARERLQLQIEGLASDLLTESEQGELSSERKTYYRSRSASLAEALARLER